MPNGYPFWAQCHFCRRWADCHGRNNEDYEYWVGTWCNDCLDWIEEDEDEWWCYHTRNYLLHNIKGRIICCCPAHPLVHMIQLDAVAELLTDFLQPVSDAERIAEIRTFRLFSW